MHVTVHENENDIKGKKTIVWAPLEILMSMEGLDYEDIKEMIEDFETEIEAGARRGALGLRADRPGVLISLFPSGTPGVFQHHPQSWAGR